MNNYISVPNSSLRLVDGNVVMIERFPGLKWIIHNNWYSYNNRQYVGWYFSSIPSGNIMPVNYQDLIGIQLVSASYTPQGDPGYPSGPFPVYPPYPSDSSSSGGYYDGGGSSCQCHHHESEEEKEYQIQLELAGLDNINIKAVNNRGYNTTCPENTLIAFKTSKKKGFKYILGDVRFTSDDIPVMLADDTINRTARFPDGTSLSSSVPIAGITYEEAKEYDYGIWKGNSFIGTQIPRFEEFIMCCRNIGIAPYINVQTTNTDQIQYLLTCVANTGVSEITWVSSSIETLSSIYTKLTTNKLTRKDQKHRIGYKVTAIDTTKVTAVSEFEDIESFILSNSYEYSEILLCQAQHIPLEIYNIDDIPSIILANGYVNGVVSNFLNAGQELYKEYIK